MSFSISAPTSSHGEVDTKYKLLARRQTLIAVAICLAGLLLRSDAKADESAYYFDVAIVEPGGRPGHTGFFPIQGEPIANSRVDIRARLTGPLASARFVLVDAGDLVIGEVSMATPVGSEVGTFYGNLTIPATPFEMVAEVVESSGQVYRLKPDTAAPFHPSTVRIAVRPLSVLVPGTTGLIEATVTNHGPDADFEIAFEDNAGGIASPTVQIARVPRDESLIRGLKIEVPPGAFRDFQVYRISGHAKSVADPSVRNSAEKTFPIHELDGLPIGTCALNRALIDTNRDPAGLRVSVVVFGDSRVDVADIDPASVRLAGVIPPTDRQARDVGPPSGSICEVRRADGRSDLVLMFDAEASLDALESLAPGLSRRDSAVVSLDATTFSGRPLIGLVELSPRTWIPVAPLDSPTSPKDAASDPISNAGGQ